MTKKALRDEINLAIKYAQNRRKGTDDISKKEYWNGKRLAYYECLSFIDNLSELDEFKEALDTLLDIIEEQLPEFYSASDEIARVNDIYKKYLG